MTGPTRNHGVGRTLTVNTRLYTCSESTPFHGNGRCGETEQGRGTEGLETKTAQSPTDSTISRPTPTSNTPAQGLSSQPNNSATVILAEFEVGKEVSVPVKYNSAVPGYTYMADGLVTLSKTLFKFRPTYGSEPFAVSPEKILELVIEPQQASRLLVKVAVLNKKGNKEEKRNYYFYPAGAVGVGGGPGGQGASISCSSCNDSMTVLHALLLKFRGTGSL